MSRKKTHEEYKKDVPEDYEVLEPYINTATKILHKHIKCGHEWLVLPKNILSGSGCPECAGTRKKTHEEYKKEVPEDYEVLEPYVRALTKILHKHLVCGYEWQVKPSDILSGSGCPECAGTRKKTHEEYKKEVPEDYEVLEPYTTNKVKILHKHIKCGHEWLVSPNSILSGQGCPECGGTRKKTHEEYKKEVPEDYEVLEPYIGAMTKILHKHLVCGHEWTISPSHILSGQGCPECAGQNANKVYLMYFPELNLYKIGISNNPEKRAKQFGYKADIFWVEEYPTHEEAKARETYLLSKVTLVNTGLLISGNTETFYDR